MAESNLTMAGVLVLLDSPAPQDKTKGLRLLAELLRRGVTMPPKAVEAIAGALDDHAGSLAKSGRQGGTPRRQSNFLGYVVQVLVRELGLEKEDAIRLLLDYLDAHNKPLPDASTLRKLHRPYAGHVICEPESLDGVNRVLTWARTRQVSA